MKRKSKLVIRHILRMVSTLLSGILMFTVLCMSFETVFPLTLQKVEITNGKQTVIFESMIHIASPHFYDMVREDIRDEKAKGAVYYYEGIRHENRSEITELTTRLTGGVLHNEDLGHSYGFLASIAGLQMQPQETFLGLSGAPDVNADMTAAELLALIKKRTDFQPISLSSGKSITTGNELDDMATGYRTLSDKEKKIVNVLTRNLVSLIVRGNSLVYDGVADKEEMEVIRNKYLADMVRSGPARIIITYGSAHLEGFFNEMHSRDSEWHVVNTTYRTVFTP